MNIFIASKTDKKQIIESQVFPIVMNLEGDNYVLILNEFEYDASCYRYSIRADSFISFFFKNKARVENVYVRCVFDFIKIFLLKKLFFSKWKITFDFRGILPYELKTKGRSKFKQNICFGLEFFVFNAADRVHCVSNKMKRYLTEHYGERLVKVIPCGVAPFQSSIKKVQRKSNLIKFVYSGGLSEWQCFDSVCNIMRTYQDLEHSFSFTVFTLDVDKAREITSAAGLRSDLVEFKKLAQADVVSELSAYDFGFLLRNNEPTNNVASPIKFSEYVVAGVIPIISTGVGDYSELVQNENIGILINSFEILPEFDVFFELLASYDYKKLSKISSSLMWPNLIDQYFFSE